jgi:hypothetical protein
LGPSVLSAKTLAPPEGSRRVPDKRLALSMA